jgi:hypothetical protein
MAGGKSTYLANAIVAHELGVQAFTMPAAIYLALVTVLPTPSSTGSTITEVNYTGYARVHVTAGMLSSASGGTISNVSTITFPQCAGGSSTAVGWALCDAPTGGNLLLFNSFPQPTPTVTISGSAIPTLYPGQLVVQET